jgi:hypothetical protein
MSTPQNDAFDCRAPKPLDKRYLKNEIIPWVSTAEVNAGIVSAYRYQGLTVLIGSVEYWYIGGTTNSHLVPKATGSVILTLTSDSFYTFPTQSLIVALIVTPDTTINFKAGSSVGAEDFVPTIQLAGGVAAALAVFLVRNAGQNIYFGGISGSNTTVVIKTL